MSDNYGAALSFDRWRWRPNKRANFKSSLRRRVEIPKLYIRHVNLCRSRIIIIIIIAVHADGRLVDGGTPIQTRKTAAAKAGSRFPVRANRNGKKPSNVVHRVAVAAFSRAFTVNIQCLYCIIIFGGEEPCFVDHPAHTLYIYIIVYSCRFRIVLEPSARFTTSTRCIQHIGLPEIRLCGDCSLSQYRDK